MKPVIIIGGGPAGLMAAEKIAKAGTPVTVYDHMSSVGRKFLMAGRGGLNLTHSEELDRFIARYGAASAWLDPVIRHFPPQVVIDWCHDLGQPTFVGTRGRVFPQSLKASPLLRAWLRHLDKLGVRFALRQRWVGWDDQNRLLFHSSDGAITPVEASATLLALGGASWRRLGSDGGWADILTQHHIPVTPLLPANCGFTIKWSEIFRNRFEGQPLKSVTFTFGDQSVPGEAVITATGIEGGAIYALSSRMRDAIVAQGVATLNLDLRPGIPLAALTTKLETPRGSQSLSNHLRKFALLSPLAIGLLYEASSKEFLQRATPPKLAALIKACPLRLTSTAKIDRAISTAGGIQRDALDEHFMLRGMPGVFAAGEMLDWEAPTGGYLLQASFSTAIAAAEGMIAWIKTHA